MRDCGGEDWAKWLGEEQASNSELKALLAPCPDDTLKFWPVGNVFGNVRNDRADLVEPVAAS